MTPKRPSEASAPRRGPAMVLQGTFVARRPAVRLPAGAAQPQMAGNAMQLPQNFAALGRRGMGKSLPEAVLRKMEAALNADFSDVRIHVGPEAPGIGALAFAHGSDLFFAPGLYDPHTTHGQRLLGHELAHVVQQRNGRVRNPFGSGVAVVQDPALEAEADRLGMMAAAHHLPALPRQAPRSAGATGSAGCNGAQGCGASQPKMAAGSVPCAPHVAKALGVGAVSQPSVPPAGRLVAAHVAAVVGPRAAQGAGGIQAKGPAKAPVQARPAGAGAGYKLVVGSYLHSTGRGEHLPEDLAGHTFVAIQEPTGRQQAFGFSPENYSRFDPKRDYGQLRAGVRGAVHDDTRALAKPGLRTRAYSISKDQAQAAMAKVAEYRSRHYDFNLKNRACSSFAFDVARAADVDPFPGSSIKAPREIHRQL